MTQHYIGTKIVQAWEQEKDGQPGYSVKYSDGYISWCPKAQFEAANLALGHIGHLPDHQQRVVGEKAQLDDKIVKITAFFDTETYGWLDRAEQERLTVQLGAMREYSQVLDARIQAFSA